MLFMCDSNTSQFVNLPLCCLGPTVEPALSWPFKPCLSVLSDDSQQQSMSDCTIAYVWSSGTPVSIMHAGMCMSEWVVVRLQTQLEESIGVQMLHSSLELERRATSCFFWTMIQVLIKFVYIPLMRVTGSISSNLNGVSACT